MSPEKIGYINTMNTNNYNLSNMPSINSLLLGLQSGQLQAIADAATAGSNPMTNTMLNTNNSNNTLSKKQGSLVPLKNVDNSNKKRGDEDLEDLDLGGDEEGNADDDDDILKADKIVDSSDDDDHSNKDQDEEDKEDNDDIQPVELKETSVQYSPPVTPVKSATPPQLPPSPPTPLSEYDTNYDTTETSQSEGEVEPMGFFSEGEVLMLPKLNPSGTAHKVPIRLDNIRPAHLASLTSKPSDRQSLLETIQGLPNIFSQNRLLQQPQSQRQLHPLLATTANTGGFPLRTQPEPEVELSEGEIPTPQNTTMVQSDSAEDNNNSNEEDEELMTSMPLDTYHHQQQHNGGGSDVEEEEVVEEEEEEFPDVL